MYSRLWCCPSIILSSLVSYLLFDSSMAILMHNAKDRSKSRRGRRNDSESTKSTWERDPRIIGGNQAQRGRYPYMVALTHKSEQVCGGSLIADDIVLSSAHCSTLINGASIGRNDLNDESEIFEIYNIETVINHPSFQGSNDFDNDFMLLKLYGWSLKKVVTLNKDPNVPANGDELTIIGYGKDNMETTTSAGKLKEAYVYYMTNDECREKKAYLSGTFGQVSLEDMITENMLCAKGGNTDACQGDSGGGIMKKGVAPEYDVQVGVTSWGLSCAHNVFPGVSARVSSQMIWITKMVCRLSESPPEYLGCVTETDESDEEEDKVEVIIHILLDRFPGETGWLLKSEGRSIAYVPIRSYRGEQNNRVESIVHLVPGRAYTFIMLDSFGDGLNFDGGNFEVFVEHSPHKKILASGAKFGRSIHIDFFLPNRKEISQQTNGNNAQISKPPQLKQDSSLPTFAPHVDSHLHIDHLESGGNEEPQLPLLNTSKSSPMPTTALSKLITTSPSTSPSTTPHTPETYKTIFPTRKPIQPSQHSNRYLSVVIKLDSKPGEIGWTIMETDESKIISSKPIGSYDGQNYSTILEKVYLPPSIKHFEDLQYEFTIYDTGGDGVCCNNGYGLYQVFFGEVSDNQILCSGGRFQNVEKTQFYVFQSSYSNSFPFEEEEENEDVITSTIGISEGFITKPFVFLRVLIWFLVAGILFIF